MPNPVQKSLHGYLTKIKRETGKLRLSSTNSFSSSKNWVLSGCKKSKKLSFSFKHRRRSSKTRFNNEDDFYQESGHAATLSDVDRFLEENFKSLCIRDGDNEDDDEKGMYKKKGKMEFPEEEDDSSDDEEDNDYRHKFERTWGPAVYDSTKPPDAHQSEMQKTKTKRLSPPPVLSEGSTTTEERQSSSNSSKTAQMLPESCIAVLRYTEEPLEDFRRSMLEMMESKLGMRDKEVDWDLMEELLFCYLDLNDKKSHRFILSAFADLIISLREKERRITRKGLVRSLSTRVARERLRKKMSLSDAFPN